MTQSQNTHLKSDPRFDRGTLPEILARLEVVNGPDGRGEYVAWCIFHPDKKGRDKDRPNLHVSARGYHCFSCGAKGSLSHLAEHLGISVTDTGIVMTYDYVDERGNLLFQVVRRRNKDFQQRKPDGKGGWIWNVKGVRRVLYRLPHVISSGDNWIWIVEGEKDVDSLTASELAATTNSGGAGKWRDEYSEFLKGRRVGIIPDNDEPGTRHAEMVATSLYGKAAAVRIVHLHGLPAGGDVSDWLQAGHKIEELHALLESATEFEPKSGMSENDRDVQKEASESQADRIISLVNLQDATLFHTGNNEAFVRIRVDNHYEIWPCRHRQIQRWLSMLLYKHEGKAPPSETIRSALNVLEARAVFEGQEYSLHNRVALDGDTIWFDLADTEWRAAKIDAMGWRIIHDPPIMFRRYGHQLAQVEPLKDKNDLREFLPFINVKSPSDQILVLVWSVTCLVPNIPHPILMVHGPHGSAKTTTLRMIRRLVDPSRTETLALHNEFKELVQQLSHQWAPCFDNISTFSPRISDGLCRAVTGEGFSKRGLYTNDEDVIYCFSRCVSINGINVVAYKPDLLDRSLLVSLEPIDQNDRRPEKVILARFESVRPRLVSALFSTLSRAIALRPTIRLSSYPRMADFVEWGCAIAAALGYAPDDFLRAYEQSSRRQNEEVLESNAVAKAVLYFMRDKDEWAGEPSQLLAELQSAARSGTCDIEVRELPKAANKLSHGLNLVAPNLASLGIGFGRGKPGGRRQIRLRRIPPGHGVGIEAGSSARPSIKRTNNHNGVDDSDDGDGTSSTPGNTEKGDGETGESKANSHVGDSTVITVHTVTPGLTPCLTAESVDGQCDDNRDCNLGRLSRPSHLSPCLPDLPSRWPEPWRDRYEERAAIMEYHGHLSREDAEEWTETFLRRLFEESGGKGNTEP